MKYIIVCGGCISGIGKGIVTSSLAYLLKTAGHYPTCIKIDPYLNCDAGNMSPDEHGEVFVLRDGSELDLDLGNYEHFLEIHLTTDHSITNGKMLKYVIDKERKQEYLGQTVQVVPHFTDAVLEHIKKTALLPVDEEEHIPDVCLIELGGVVSELESLWLVEALRQLYTTEMCFLVHVSLLIIHNEPKTKPIQQSIRQLQSYFASPDLLVVRSEESMDDKSIKKLTLHCKNIINMYNVDNIYKVPQMLYDQNVLNLLHTKLGTNLSTSFKEMSIPKKLHLLKIGIIGKYTKSVDSYLSLLRALNHASGIYTIIPIFINTDHFNEDSLKNVQGIIIPGGFGLRGIPSKLQALQYARINNIPCLGICLGMQLMAIEFARNVLKLEDADSQEFNNQTSHPIVIAHGEMIKGLQVTETKSNLLLEHTLKERHRHRYKLNNDYISLLETNGFKISGYCKQVATMMELTNHKFYLGTQFHPEFETSLLKPSIVFKSFIGVMNNDFLQTQ